MIKFPENRRVPPPDFEGTASRRVATGSARAIVFAPARQPPPEHAFFVLASPHEPSSPRTLVFAKRTSPPGSPPGSIDTRVTAAGVRAIVHPPSRVPEPERNYYPPAKPRPAGSPRSLHFAAEQIKSPPLP